MTTALEGGEWSAARRGRTLPPGKTRYPFYRRLGGPQGRSGRTENLVPTGIRSWTVQPVAQSLYRLSYPAHTARLYLLLFHDDSGYTNVPQYYVISTLLLMLPSPMVTLMA